MSHNQLAFYRRNQFEIISFVVGAVELTVELTASRIVAPYIGLTIYVWTSIIGVILAALALGYLVGGRLADKRKEPLDVVFLLLVSAILIGVIDAIKDPFLNMVSQWSLPPQLQALVMSCLLFAAPTIVLGAVTPYLARLSITDVGTSGQRVSRINAAGTFGALFGTFFTGFYLFALVGTRNILELLGFTLVAMSFCLATAKQNKLRWLLVTLAVILLVMPSKLHLANVSKDFDTAYNRYMIRDSPKERILQGDKLAWESGINKNPNAGPLFSYVRAFTAVAAMPASPKNYLVIGGGAYTLPTFLTKAEPHANIDVVEIDQELLPISEQYFGFKQSPNIHVFSEDGRQFLNNNRKQYNMIYMDAFSNSIPPFQLLTLQANDDLRDSLAPGGIVAVNIVSKISGTGASFISSIAQTYGQAFSNVRLFSLNPTAKPSNMQNILLLARQGPLDPAINAVAAKNPEFHSVTQNALVPNNSSGIVLTDDFAPVDQMLARQQ